MNIFIDNVQRAWRLATVWVGALAVAWGLLPADQQAAVLAFFHCPPERVPAVLGLAFLVARIVRQANALQPPQQGK